VGEWFEDLFDERYLLFCEEALAQGASVEEIDFIESALALERGSSILDLGCGFGRHAIPLAQRGYVVTGVDLSEYLLEVARDLAGRLGATASWLQQDMRKLGNLGPFDACVCLYTAFGYFADDENAEVLRRIREVLRPGGPLLLDVNNPLSLLPRLPDDRWRESSRGVRRETSTYDPLTGQLVTERVLYRNEGGKVRLPTSRVRLYPPHELARLLRDTGFEVEQVHGGLRGARLDWKSSVMQSWVARRS